MTRHFHAKDHPAANGRKPQKGEHAYTFTFPLDDGTDLKIHCGDETMDKFREFLGSMTIDDAADAT